MILRDFLNLSSAVIKFLEVTVHWRNHSLIVLDSFVVSPLLVISIANSREKKGRKRRKPELKKRKWKKQKEATLIILLLLTFIISNNPDQQQINPDHWNNDPTARRDKERKKGERKKVQAIKEEVQCWCYLQSTLTKARDENK